MKALRFEQDRLGLHELTIPNAKGEARVRVLKSGICNTDLEIIRGYAGFEGTIGHEFVGVVEAAEDSPGLVGKRVVGEINVGCGTCELCLRGDPRHCPGRTVLGIKGRDGAHAEYLTLPTRNLYEVPDGLTNEHAVFIEPFAAALGITEQVDVEPDTTVAVIGDGKLGLLCAMILAQSSKCTSLIGKHSSKLKLVERRGIETVLLAETDPILGRFDVVVEASGSESGFATALDLVKPRGRIVLKSTFRGKPTWEAWRVVVNEITVVGSRCGRFEPALKLLSNGSLDLSDLISDEFPISEGIRAVERAGEPGVLKVLLNMTN